VPKFAIIENAKVTNVIMANSKTFAKKIGHAVEVTAATGEAIIGLGYNEVAQLFEQPKPYDSWQLDESNYSWVAPKPQPKDVEAYWDEEAGDWTEVNAAPNAASEAQATEWADKAIYDIENPPVIEEVVEDVAAEDPAS